LTCLFHFSSAGVLGFVIAVAEAFLCLRRRRFSHLLGAALVTMIPAVVFGLIKSADPVVGTSATALAAILHGLLSSPQAVIGSGIWSALLLALALGLLARRDEEWDGVARFALLLIAVAVAQLSNLLLGDDRMFAPGFYVLVELKTYFVPAIDLGIVLGITGLLVRYALRAAPGAEPAADVPAPHRQHLVPVAAIMCLIVAGAPGISSGHGAKALLNGGAMAFLGRMPLEWRNLAIAAKDDDVYYVNTAKPLNDPIVYFSLLKMKVRKAAGRFDPMQLRIEAIDTDSASRATAQP
jgi:hypothetical protein